MAVSTDLLKVTNFNNVSARKPVVVLTDDYTVKPEESGFVFMIGTDAKVITLPSAASAGPGFSVKVVNIGADGDALVSISPAAADSIRGTIQQAAAIGTSGAVANKDWLNTKATALRGDYTELVSDGALSWYIVGGAGIWASEG